MSRPVDDFLGALGINEKPAINRSHRRSSAHEAPRDGRRPRRSGERLTGARLSFRPLLLCGAIYAAGMGAVIISRQCGVEVPRFVLPLVGALTATGWCISDSRRARTLTMLPPSHARLTTILERHGDTVMLAITNKAVRSSAACSVRVSVLAGPMKLPAASRRLRWPATEGGTAPDGVVQPGETARLVIARLERKGDFGKWVMPVYPEPNCGWGGCYTEGTAARGLAVDLDVALFADPPPAGGNPHRLTVRLHGPEAFIMAHPVAVLQRSA